MKVRFKPAWQVTYPELTPGNAYRVIEIAGSRVRVLDDTGRPLLYLRQAFEIIDDRIPPDWEKMVGDDGDEYLQPGQFRSGFFEQWFDGSDEARRELIRYVRGLCCDDLKEKSCDETRYLAIKSESQEIYVQVDQDGWEIRRIQKNVQGQWDYADGNGASGDFELARIDATTEHTAMSPEQFEIMWRNLSKTSGEQLGADE